MKKPVAKITESASPLSIAVESVLNDYFHGLNGQSPTNLRKMVVQEVEYPLFKRVMHETQGNKCRAAKMLGINRNTLQTRLIALGLIDVKQT